MFCFSEIVLSQFSFSFLSDVTNVLERATDLEPAAATAEF